MVNKVNLIIREFLSDIAVTLDTGIKQIASSNNTKALKHYETKEFREFKLMLVQSIKGREILIAETIVKLLEMNILKHIVRQKSLTNERFQVPMAGFYRDIGNALSQYYWETLRDIDHILDSKDIIGNPQNLTYEEFLYYIQKSLDPKISSKSVPRRRYCIAICQGL